MFLTIHGTVGAIIGQNLDNVWLSFILGVVSHLLLDIIPHGDETLINDKNSVTKSEVKKIAEIAAVDGLIMSGLVLTLINQGLIDLSWPVLFGIFGSILPDFITGFYLLFKFPWLKKILDFHFNLHLVLQKFKVSLAGGILIQLIVLFSSLIIIRFLL